MNINTYIDTNMIKHVSVNGEITSREEINSLLNHLDDCGAREFSVTFFDANILHSDIIEKLHNMKKAKRCRIYVFKRYLYSYLYNLGIKCNYINNKSLEMGKGLKPIEDIPTMEDVAAFLNDIYSVYGYDYKNYQIDSIMRRIKISMLKENIGRFSEFRRAVLEDVNIFEQLFLDLSINTTEFFRDPEVFLVMRNKLLPYLDSYMHIKIWCVGCSNGKEPYSLAILLNELGLLHKTHIYATDINPYIIEEAKNGLFSIGDIDKNIINYKMAGGRGNFIDYFDLKESYIKIKSYLSKNILFFQHSLTGSGSLNEFQLILCRNVLIYFNHDLQNKVIENFYNSLDRSGFLILGKSEGMMLNGGEYYFKRYMDKEKIYKVRQI